MNIDPIKSKAFGVMPGRKYRLLKAGTVLVYPDDVRASSRIKPRKLVVIPDHQQLSPSLRNLGYNTDVLIHEATLTNELANEVGKRGHATAAMAGQVAREMNASVLVLNHLSPRHSGRAARKKKEQEEESDSSNSN